MSDPLADAYSTLRRIDQATAAGLYFCAMLRERFDSQDVHADDVKIIDGIAAVFSNIEALVSDQVVPF